MYLLLLVFGALSIAAGLLLAATGISIHDRVFDPTLIAPGTLAVVGGLLLIGVGFAVRVLQRIEHALTARPIPRVARLGEPSTPAGAAEPDEPAVDVARIPFPPKPAARSPLAPVAPSLVTTAPSAAAEDKTVEQLREKFATSSRFDNGGGSEPDASAPARPFTAGEDQNGDAADLRRLGQSTNGAAAPPVARLDADSSRPAAPVERSRVQTFWSKRARRRRPAGPAQPAPDFAEQDGAAGPSVEELAEMVHAESSAPLSILKSGVVDGMAYTLYSDGSIEAQLPQGTLRFGSITELRNHIEQAS